MEIDARTQGMLDLLYPDFKVRVIRVYNSMFENHGLKMKSTEGMRSFATQLRLYAKGRTTLGPDVSESRPMGRTLTNSKPGLSNHSYGVAIDSCFTGPDAYLDRAKLKSFFWEQYAKIAESYGLKAGYRFKSVDGPHIELMYGGLTVQNLFDLYQHRGLQSVWAKFDQVRGVPIGQEWSRMKMFDPGKLTT